MKHINSYMSSLIQKHPNLANDPDWLMIEEMIGELSPFRIVQLIRESALSGIVDSGLINQFCSLCDNKAIMSRIKSSAADPIVKKDFLHMKKLLIWSADNGYQPELIKLCNLFDRAYADPSGRKACFANKRTCHQCGYHYPSGLGEGWQDIVSCPECRAMRLPCGESPCPNGRCAFHGGKHTIHEPGTSLTDMRIAAMSRASSEKGELLARIINSPDILNSVADIAVLEMRQMEINEHQISVGDVLDCVSLFVSAVKRLSAEDTEPATLFRMVDELMNQLDKAKKSNVSAAEYQKNALILSKLKKAQHDMLIAQSKIYTEQQHLQIIRQMRESVVLAVKNGVKQVARTIIEGELIRPEMASDDIERAVSVEVFRSLERMGNNYGD